MAKGWSVGLGRAAASHLQETIDGCCGATFSEGPDDERLFLAGITGAGHALVAGLVLTVTCDIEIGRALDAVTVTE